MDPILDELFLAARGPITERPFMPRADANLVQIGTHMGDGKSAGRLKDEIGEAMRLGGWSLYMLHGVGPGTHSLHIQAADHLELLDWLQANAERVWVAPG